MSRKGDLDRDSFFKSILGDIGESPEPDSSGIALEQIIFNPDQPRRHFPEEALAELAESIRSRGVLEPVLVRRREDGFELIAGERRTRAAQLAGLTHVPAVVLDVADDEALEISIMENLQREDLNAVEETEAVLRLLQLHLNLEREGVLQVLQDVYNEERGRSGSRRHGAEVQEELKSLLGRLGRFTPSSFYVNRVPILSFPEELLEAVRGGSLTFTKAQVLARVTDARRRKLLLKEAVAENLSLSQLRARVRAETTGARPEPAGSGSVAETRKLRSPGGVARLPDSRRKKLEKLLAEIRELFSD